MATKKVTAHIKTGNGLVGQTLVTNAENDMLDMVANYGFKYLQFDTVGRGKVLIRIEDVAFWTYD